MAVEVPVKKLRYYWPVYLLIAIPLLLVIVFSYYPIYNGMVHIFYRWNGDTVEEFIGMGNLIRVMQDTTLLHSFGVVLIFVVANVIKMILPIITAVILHHVISDRMGYLYRVMFVIPMIIPGMVGILIWKYFYEPNNGILNGLLRMMGFLSPTDSIQWLSDERLIIPSLIFMGFPWVGAFGVLIYLAGLQSIPEDVYEAAEVDGAGPFRIFWQIIVPAIKPILGVIALFAFRQAWNEFVTAQVFTMANPGLKTLSVAVANLRYSANAAAEWHIMTAGASIALLPILLVYLAANRQFIAGLTAGAVKG